MTHQPAPHRTMQERLWRCLADPKTRSETRKDFAHILTHVGLPEYYADGLVTEIFRELENRQKPLSAVEDEIYAMLNNIVIPGERKKLIDAIDANLEGRAALIFSQIGDHVKDATGDVIDFGCGDAQVTQMIADSLQRQNIRVVGADVRDYRAPQTKHLPFSLIKTGAQVVADPQAFELAVLTNVLHHEADNEQILNELDRIVRDRLVVIETVPIGTSETAMEADKDRTFMNDYFYNRLLHDPKIDVPVPGTFETPKGWKDRFAAHGWKVTHEEDLGIDQPVIHDRHYLMVLEREQSGAGKANTVAKS